MANLSAFQAIGFIVGPGKKSSCTTKYFKQQVLSSIRITLCLQVGSCKTYLGQSFLDIKFFVELAVRDRTVFTRYSLIYRIN